MSKRNWKDETELRNKVCEAQCISEVLRSIKLQINGNNSATLKKYIELYNIDISHFLDKRGLSTQRKMLISKSNEEIFIENSNTCRSVVKKRILSQTLIPYICSLCDNVGIWNNQRLSLQLEHKNGINTDHRLENLEFLCPNCHSQTATFAGRNTKGHSFKEEKKRNRVLHRKIQKEQKNIENTRLINIVMSSNIDYSKFGWKRKIAIIINKQPQKLKQWMSKNMPEVWAAAKHTNH